MPVDLAQRVVQFLHLYNTHSQPLRLGVAVSGGADSVVLLHLLSSARESVSHITVLHVNHALRGFDSQNDELFVRHLAATLGWPIEVQQGPPAPGNLEAEARRVRRDFFRRARAQFNLDFVALGHNQGDQAETVLFRLLRGSGVRGLGGMAPAADGFLRPLLTSSRDEIRAWARDREITWREDNSNQDMGFRRNWLRFAALPELARQLNPRLQETLAATAEIARDEEAYWSAKTARTLARVSSPYRAGPDLVVDAVRLRRLHPALQRRLIRAALEKVLGHLSAIGIPHIQAIRDVVFSPLGHARVQVPNADILRSFDSILFARPDTLRGQRDFHLYVPLDTEVQLPFGVGALSVNTVTSEIQNCANVKKKEECSVNADAVESLGLGLSVRNWQPGDAITLPVSDCPVKLKTLFQQDRVVLWERRHWPVLVVGEEIIWTRRFGVAAQFAAAAGSRKSWLVRYHTPEGSGHRK